MRIVRVGGCVRDEIMGRKPHDIDYCVEGSTIDEMISLGYKQVGNSFPVFLDDDGNEYALCRKEISTGNGYNDFEFDFNPNVTLYDDAYRRDFTCNAMFMLDNGEIIDYFNGVDDIKNKKLKHISPHFIECPLRIIRASRFSAQLGFDIDDETKQLCKEMIGKGMLKGIAKERLWKEIEKALKSNDFASFIESLDELNALQEILPEVYALKDVPENILHHPCGNTYNHTILALKQGDRMNLSPNEKFALLCHDLGKALTPKDILPKHYGHELNGLKLIERLCDRLSVPNDYKKFALLASKNHMNAKRIMEMRPITLYKFTKESSMNFKDKDTLIKVLNVSDADSMGRLKEVSMDKYILCRERCLNMYDILKDVSADNFPELKKYNGKQFGEMLDNKKIQYYLNKIKPS
jgi:tRNA nucleotidyltransferase (CCA-adding enzyme)